MEGGDGGLLFLSPVVGVLRVVRHRRVGRSSSVVSVHANSVLCSFASSLSGEVVPFRRRLIVVFFAIVCWLSVVSLCWSDDNKQRIRCSSFSYQVAVNDVAPALCVINTRERV